MRRSVPARAAELPVVSLKAVLPFALLAMSFLMAVLVLVTTEGGTMRPVRGDYLREVTQDGRRLLGFAP